ncbi:hypothetical protein HanIR_Chr12g0579181 [Helianthus annuus]|nr:hypothetical protein HanIR_Chr12g0579181 [Helianthus annuus]
MISYLYLYIIKQVLINLLYLYIIKPVLVREFLGGTILVKFEFCYFGKPWLGRV